MEPPTISFIVPTIDRRDSLMRCLESAAAQEYPRVELVVIDDDSNDGTPKAVQEGFPDAIYLHNPQRIGLGPALRMGAEAASGSIWVCMDDDGYLAETDAAERIARLFAEQPDLGAIAFKVEAPDGSVRHREIPLRSKRLPDGDTDIAYFNGGAVAFRADALTEVGGFPDARYYSWEQYVSFRFLRTGWRILFAPEIRFVHLAIPSPINTSGREEGYVEVQTALAATFLPFPYAQVHTSAWALFTLIEAAKKGHLSSAWSATVRSLGQWGTFRSDRSNRLSVAEARRMTALSGRTWY